MVELASLNWYHTWHQPCPCLISMLFAVACIMLDQGWRAIMVELASLISIDIIFDLNKSCSCLISMFFTVDVSCFIKAWRAIVVDRGWYQAWSYLMEHDINHDQRWWSDALNQAWCVHLDQDDWCTTRLMNRQPWASLMRQGWSLIKLDQPCWSLLSP